MRNVSGLVTMLCLFAVCSAPAVLAEDVGRSAEPSVRAKGGAARPSLQVHQGRYFRYAMPEGWRANETTNGVDMIGPDGVTGASFALLVGAFGQTTPEGFITASMRQLNLGDFETVSMKRLPGEPGPFGFAWQVAEARLRYRYSGRAVQAWVLCGVIQGWNQFSAITRAYQTPIETWERDRVWLPAVAESVLITNPRQVAGVDRMPLPRNIPHDEIYGAYNRAWEARQIPDDRISEARHEATMGYERMKDPETGRLYDMPLEAYDPTMGGYRNPMRPAEVLQRAAPGE